MKSMANTAMPMAGKRPRRPASGPSKCTAMYRLIVHPNGGTGSAAMWRAATILSERGPFTSRDLAQTAGVLPLDAQTQIKRWLRSGRVARVRDADDGDET